MAALLPLQRVPRAWSVPSQGRRPPLGLCVSHVLDNRGRRVSQCAPWARDDGIVWSTEKRAFLTPTACVAQTCITST